MLKHSLKLSILISVLLFALVSCNGSKEANNKEEKLEVLPEDIVELRGDQIKLAKVETGVFETISLSGTLKVSGTVAAAPQNYATVSMPLGGFVKSTTLLPGNAVSKGQTLAILENQEFVEIQQSYLETKSKFEYAEAEYNRQNELYKNDVSSKKNMQQVTSEYKSLKVQVKALEQKLSLIGINSQSLNDEGISNSIALVSPISGYVKAVNVNIGKFVSPSDVLFEIVNTSNLYLELTLFDKDVSKVSKNQKIRFFINDETEQHDAIVYQTGKSVNSDKTYTVFASVLGVCENVLPGMYVNAIIETTSSKVTALPSDAIVSFDDKDYIFIFNKDKEEDGQPFTEYRMIQVQKGVADNGYTEVILPEGIDIKTVKVVVKGAYNLLSAKKNAGEMAC
jgi:RND family efflux transporter MFP subunit